MMKVPTSGGDDVHSDATTTVPYLHSSREPCGEVLFSLSALEEECGAHKDSCGPRLAYRAI